MTIGRYTGAVNDNLVVLLYRDQFRLETTDAMYSDGDRYQPAIAAVKRLKYFLPQIKTVLVLGTGLGSLVYVLRGMGANPAFTLVEKDKVVLRIAMELFEANNMNAKVEPVCSDAQVFMEHNKAKFDFVFLDVFNGRAVPEFVTTPGFLTLCRESITPGGHLAFNYIINDAQEWEKVRSVFTAIFPKHTVLDYGINRILVV